MRSLGFLVLISSALAAATCAPTTSGGDGDPGTEPRDSDGDCISDEEEGAVQRSDTDADGLPDFLDEDSDGDSIADAVEAVNPECNTSMAAADGDEDGTPNFRDLDSDGDGILDRNAETGDVDGDGTPDFASQDDDGDFIPDLEEMGPDINDPADSDGDGIADYRDSDSDDDLVFDRDERGGDSDEDGMPDYVDPDSDNDGVDDRTESGDRDINTPPVDSDEDGLYDFRDVDSDNDGLTDAFEVEHRSEYGTDPRDADTDDDEVMDWIEVAAGTDPTNGMDSPLTRGDFVFIVPYQETPDPPEDTLDFSTNLRLGDVFFALDRTYSMETELDSIRTKLIDIIEAVTCGPGETPDEFNPCIPDLWVGFSWFTDINDDGFGGDYRALQVEHNLTDDFAAVIGTMPTTPTDGGDECQRRAAFCTVHGPGGDYCPEDMTLNMDEYPCPGAGIGFPCFRPDAARMLVLITDENMDQDPLPDYDTVANELLSAQITFIGVNAEETMDSEVTADLTEIAARTESFDEFGAPLVFLGAEDTVDETVAEAIRTVARIPLDVTATVIGNVEHGIDPADFIEYLAANVSGGPCSAWEDVRDSDGDGRNDTFIQIEPGTPVCWDVRAAVNTVAPPTEEPQVFTATIEVRGGAGRTLLDMRDVYFLVPPTTYVPPPA